MPDLTAEDVETSLITFAERTLGLSLYDWQCDAIEPFDYASEEMVRVSVATPNGAGKGTVLITSLVLGWLSLYPKGRVVLTSADGRQIDSQVMVAIESHRAKFPSWKFIEREVHTPTGGFFVAFTTDSPGKCEGWHKVDDNEGPLLWIVDEAKSVDEGIFQAVDRCTYNALLLCSSPGKMSGRFYESQFKPELGFTQLAVGLKDCPHITQDKIDRIIAQYGPNSPFTRSALHGEFIEIWDGDPVFYAYSMEGHEIENLGWPQGATLCVGMDVGTYNATVIAAVKKTQWGVYIWVLREIVMDGSDTERQAIACLKLLATEFPFWNKGLPVCPQTLFFCDPAARNSAFTARGPTASALKVLQSHRIFPGMKTGVQLQPSIALVNRLLQQNHSMSVTDVKTGEETHKTVWHFRIDATRCPNLTRALRGEYRYPTKDQPGYGSDRPLKGILSNMSDHVADALRYLCINAFDLALESHSDSMTPKRKEAISSEARRTI